MFELSPKGIYRFAYNCGRMGKLSGLFIATAAAIERAKGRTVCLGEVLGKHSEIDVDIDTTVTLVTQDADAVAMFEHHNLTTGYDPLEYLDEQEADELPEDQER